MQYIIKFFSEYVTATDKTYQKGDIIEVDKEEMFHWVETSKNEDIPIIVYETKIILDLM